VEQNIADGIVEDVLDRNGEESSKSCGVVGVMLTFFKELKAKEKKERRRSSFSTKAKVFCVPVLHVVFEYLNIIA